MPCARRAEGLRAGGAAVPLRQDEGAKAVVAQTALVLPIPMAN